MIPRNEGLETSGKKLAMFRNILTLTLKIVKQATLKTRKHFNELIRSLVDKCTNYLECYNQLYQSDQNCRCNNDHYQCSANSIFNFDK
jgi:hypothetical protein